MATTNKNEDEWLQFMEFIRRKYGNNSSDFIRINDYNSRSSKSVAEYYKQKYPTLNININDNLEKLLKVSKFNFVFSNILLRNKSLRFSFTECLLWSFEVIIINTVFSKDILRLKFFIRSITIVNL